MSRFERRFNLSRWSRVLDTSLRSEARVVALWTMVMFAVGAATMLLFRPFLAATWLDRFLADLPRWLRSFLGIGPLRTPAQFLDGVVFGFFAPVVFMTFGIGVGSRAVTGHGPASPGLGSERMSAAGLVLVKMAGLATGAVVIGIGASLGMLVGARVAGGALDPANVTVGVGADILLGISLGAIALLAGAVTNSFVMAGWIATAVAFAADGLRGLGAAVGQLADLRYTSLLYYADGEPASRGVTPAHEAALLVVIVGVSTLAAVASDRRAASPPAA